MSKISPPIPGLMYRQIWRSLLQIPHTGQEDEHKKRIGDIFRLGSKTRGCQP